MEKKSVKISEGEVWECVHPEKPENTMVKFFRTYLIYMNTIVFT
jgi:hypothetical protein